MAAAIRSLGGETELIHRDLGERPPAAVLDCFDASAVLPAPDAGQGEPRPGHAGWAGVSAAADVSQTLDALDRRVPDWIVLDHYGFDAAWITPMRAALGCRVMAIDDLGDRALPVDLLVDHNVADDHRAKHRLSPGARLLCGPRHALLGPAYRDAPRWQERGEVRIVGIFMGGIDAANATRIAIDACRRAGHDGRIAVATTGANPHLADIEELVRSDDRIAVHVDLPDLAAFFADEDIQIGAGGGASWERCCIGAPSLVVATAPNQAVPIAGLARHEAALTLDRPDPDAMTAAVRTLVGDRALRASLSAAARALVDGRGSERVALAMAGRVSLGPAGPEHCEMAFRWRNHPVTRASSLDDRELQWDAHRDWWARTLVDPDRALLICSVGPTPVGILRLDRHGEDAEMSVYLDPELSGLGLGTLAVGAAAEHGLGPMACARIVATIRPENHASRTAFERAGFVFDGGRWVRGGISAGRT